MKKKPIIKLSSRQKNELFDITKKGKHNARVIRRARILLESSKGLSAKKVALICASADRTVERIRAKFLKGGLEQALYDATRPGQPMKITDTVEAHLIALAVSDPPDGRERWTLELLRKKLIKNGVIKEISTVAIWERLKNREIKPWREKNVVYTKSNP